MEQPLRPGRHTRQHEKSDQEEQNALKNRQEKTKYAEEDKAPTGNMNRGALESGLCHDEDNESLTDAVLMRIQALKLRRDSGREAGGD